MASSRQIERTAADWLAKRDGEHWTHRDELALGRWLSESTANRVAFIRLEAAWRGAGRLKALGAGSAAGRVPPLGELLDSPYFQWYGATQQGSQAGELAGRPTQPLPRPSLIANAYRTTRSSRRSSKAAAIAATVLLACALSISVYLWPNGTIYQTGIGGLASVHLPDGSVVTLNTDSSIRVEESKAERRVLLEHGEAFFKVAKDPRRPFVVRAGHERIVDVGTRFSVQRTKQGLRVIVTEGRIQVDHVEGRHVEVLTQVSAGSEARASDVGVLVQAVSHSEAQTLLSWRTGFLIFRDTPLREVAAELNRYNVRELVIRDPALASIRISGTFRSTNLEGFVRLLETGLPIQSVRRGNRIVLKSQ